MAQKQTGTVKLSVQKIKEAADAHDRRRQRQIATQAARMEGMKEVILSMAKSIQNLEKDAGHPFRSVDQIIRDHS
jgi:hypothetical protein